MCQSRGRGLSGWGHRGRPEQHRPFLKGCQQGGVTTECHQHSPGTRSSGKHGAGSQNPPLEPPSPNIPRAQTPPGGATSKGLCSWSRRMVPWGPPQPPGMAASGAGSSRTPARRLSALLSQKKCGPSSRDTGLKSNIFSGLPGPDPGWAHLTSQ